MNYTPWKVSQLQTLRIDQLTLLRSKCDTSGTNSTAYNTTEKIIFWVWPSYVSKIIALGCGMGVNDSKRGLRVCPRKNDFFTLFDRM